MKLFCTQMCLLFLSCLNACQDTCREESPMFVYTVQSFANNLSPFTQVFKVHTQNTLTIGRSRKVDLLLNEESLSRRHVRITEEDNFLYIEDLGSSNGTWLEHRIPVCNSDTWPLNERKLIPGERLRFESKHRIKLTPDLYMWAAHIPPNQDLHPARTLLLDRLKATLTVEDQDILDQRARRKLIQQVTPIAYKVFDYEVHMSRFIEYKYSRNNCDRIAEQSLTLWLEEGQHPHTPVQALYGEVRALESSSPDMRETMLLRLQDMLSHQEKSILGLPCQNALMHMSELEHQIGLCLCRHELNLQKKHDYTFLAMAEQALLRTSDDTTRHPFPTRYKHTLVAELSDRLLPPNGLETLNQSSVFGEGDYLMCPLYNLAHGGPHEEMSRHGQEVQDALELARAQGALWAVFQ